MKTKLLYPLLLLLLSTCAEKEKIDPYDDTCRFGYPIQFAFLDAETSKPVVSSYLSSGRYHQDSIKLYEGRISPDTRVRSLSHLSNPDFAYMFSFEDHQGLRNPTTYLIYLSATDIDTLVLEKTFHKRPPSQCEYPRHRAWYNGKFIKEFDYKLNETELLTLYKK